MTNRDSFVRAGAVATILVDTFALMLMFRHTKKIESDFNNKKAALIKQSMDLRDRFTSLQEQMAQKAEALELLEVENKRLIEEYKDKFTEIQEQNEVLTKELRQFKERPLVEQLRGALQREDDQNMKDFLSKMIYNIVLIKSGKSIELEPIVVAQEGEGAAAIETAQGADAGLPALPAVAQSQALELAEMRGRILSVDNKYNLVVFDLGRQDNVKEKQRCVIIQGEDEIASGRVISVRYRVSAAFIDKTKYRYKINDIQEGDTVAVID
jgi:ribosomal protein S17E